MRSSPGRIVRWIVAACSLLPGVLSFTSCLMRPCGFWMGNLAGTDVDARNQKQLDAVRPPARAHTAANLHEHGTSLPSASMSGDGSNLVGAAAATASSPTHVRVVASEALIL